MLTRSKPKRSHALKQRKAAAKRPFFAARRAGHWRAITKVRVFALLGVGLLLCGGLAVVAMNMNPDKVMTPEKPATNDPQKASEQPDAPAAAQPNPTTQNPPVAAKKPATKPPAPASNPVTGLIHQHIVTTVFWVGEDAGSDNGYIANAASAWDEDWEEHFGGFDDPDNRSGYYPAGFTPLENPFYAALPYNDLSDNGTRRSSAGSCPEAASKKSLKTSWCKNSWLAITNEKNGKTCYAQWEDAGPYGENDTAYVFGSSAPANQNDVKAGLDVSPAVRDCLGMGDTAKSTWHFTAAGSVPSGPWKQIITTTPGYEAN